MSLVYNPGHGPVAIDGGRIIGGREHADVKITELVRRHLDAGRLIETQKTAVKATRKEGA